MENALQEIGQALHSEIDTLCDPKAALLALCIAFYTSNLLNTIKAALHAVDDPAETPRGTKSQPKTKPKAQSQSESKSEPEPEPECFTESLSSYALAGEIRANYGGMMIALPAEYWSQRFGGGTTQQISQELVSMAKSARLSRYFKTRRGPKKPSPQRTGDIRQKHVSTARLLQARQAKTKGL